MNKNDNLWPRSATPQERAAAQAAAQEELYTRRDPAALEAAIGEPLKRLSQAPRRAAQLLEQYRVATRIAAQNEGNPYHSNATVARVQAQLAALQEQIAADRGQIARTAAGVRQAWGLPAKGAFDAGDVPALARLAAVEAMLADAVPRLGATLGAVSGEVQGTGGPAPAQLADWSADALPLVVMEPDPTAPPPPPRPWYDSLGGPPSPPKEGSTS